MLQYTLLENLLTPDPNDYTAQPVNVRTIDMDGIFQRIEARYPGLTPSQIAAAVNEFIDEISTITEEGSAINTPLLNTQFSTPGLYKGAMDSFDSKRHSVKLNLMPGTRLRAAVKKVKTEKVIVAEPLPHILEVKDIASDTVNDTLTPGGVVQLRGGRLKFLPAEANNGIFLINSEQNVETKLVVIVENKPARLIAVLPTDLAQGDYFIEVRTSCSATGKPMKSLKQGRYNKILSV
jgi:hypothetical protein